MYWRPYLNQFVLVYLDDILIYSRSPEEHRRHVRLVLQALRSASLYANTDKCVNCSGSRWTFSDIGWVLIGVLAVGGQGGGGAGLASADVEKPNCKWRSWACPVITVALFGGYAMARAATHQICSVRRVDQ